MKKRLRRTFSSLLISYLVIMVFTIPFSIAAYYSALWAVEKDAVTTNESILKQTSEVMDAHLEEVEHIVDQISLDPTIMSFLNVEPGWTNKSYYSAMNAWRYLQTYKITSDFISNVYLVLNHNRVIISPKAMSLRLPLFYDGFLNYDGLSYDQWLAEFPDKYHNGDFYPARPINTGEGTQSYITYARSVPMGLRNTFKGTMIVLISDQKIHELLERLNLQGNGWVYMTDAQGQVITSIRGGNLSLDEITKVQTPGNEGYRPQKMDGEDMLLSYYTSPNNHWKYVSAVPKAMVMAKVDNIRRTSEWTIAIGLLAGLLIAVYFANRHSKPLRMMIRKLGGIFVWDNETDSNEYRVLDHSISRLISDNEALQSEIEKQATLLRAAFFDSLLRGEFNDTSELEDAISGLGIDGTTGNWNMVAVLQLKWLEASERTNDVLQHHDEHAGRAIIRDLLSREMAPFGFVHDLSQDRLAILLNVTQPDGEACARAAAELIQRLNRLMNQQAGVQVIFGIGSPYPHLMDVYRSYKEALLALSGIDPGKGETVLWYGQMPRETGDYGYPLEAEQRLMNLVKSGNEPEAAELLRQLRGGIEGERPMSPETLQLLVHDLTATAYKLIHELNRLGDDHAELANTDFIRHVQSQPSLREAFDVVEEAFMTLCRKVNSHKKSRNSRLKEQIIGHIQENYADGNMCLATIAQAFHISEVYLSQFFKEQTGENLSACIENTRMQRARELLMQQDLTVEEIAGRVGYHNTNTFYKAFKRVAGVSPGTFRSQSR